MDNTGSQFEFSPTEIEQAFHRLSTWMLQREIPASLAYSFMLMHKSAGAYNSSGYNLHFKNRNTRNYLVINETPTVFNQ